MAAAYTVALVLLVGGGGGDGDAPGGKATPPPVATNDLERRVARAVEGIRPKPPSDPNDRAEYRRPLVQTVRCKDDETCEIVYESGLPGRGRIFEDQQKMLSDVFSETDVRTVRIQVFRAAQPGPNTPAKKVEETPPGAPILVTRCVRTDEPTKADAGRDVDVPAVPARCEAVSVDQGANQAQSDEPRREREQEGGEDGILGID